MHHIPAGRISRPKIRTMPRSKTEASEQLELYKMVTRRQRILQEMQLTEQHLEALKRRLTVLNTEIENTEENIQKLRQSTPTSIPSATASHTTERAKSTQSESNSSDFQTFHFEY